MSSGLAQIGLTDPSRPPEGAAAEQPALDSPHPCPRFGGASEGQIRWGAQKLHRGSTDRRAPSPVGVARRLAIVAAYQLLGCLDREADNVEDIVNFRLAIIEGKRAERFNGPIVPGVGIDRNEPIGNNPIRSADTAPRVRKAAGMAAVPAHHDAPVPL